MQSLLRSDTDENIHMYLAKKVTLACNDEDDNEYKQTSANTSYEHWT